MRFHVISLPHTHTTVTFSACAYTQKVRKFCKMMMGLGHEVYLYAGEQNDAPCTEHVVCISEADRAKAVNRGHYVAASFDPATPHWRLFNAAAIGAIRRRAQPRDFIGIIAGVTQKAIADAFPDMMTVEFGIGYGGTFSKYRVWESYAWMHTCYGSANRDPHAIDGQWFEAVIPNSFDLDEFPKRASAPGDYYVFLGRLTERKGVSIAAEVCQALGARLIVAGVGEPPPYGEFIGEIGPKKRARLLSRARAVFVPTTYVEPFGGVAVEAMLCGAPVITTDWGAFTETVQHGITGFRCRTFAEFKKAALAAASLKRGKIRTYARQRYSLEAIAPQYEAYFERLATLWDKGWYA